MTTCAMPRTGSTCRPAAREGPMHDLCRSVQALQALLSEGLQRDGEACHVQRGAEGSDPDAHHADLHKQHAWPMSRGICCGTQCT